MKKAALFVCGLLYGCSSIVQSYADPSGSGLGLVSQSLLTRAVMAKTEFQKHQFLIKNNGIYITPIWFGRKVVVYPQGVTAQQVMSLHIEEINKHVTLMLTATRNRIFTLRLGGQTQLWQSVKMPDLRYGSYTIHDFLITPQGQYYLATSNGLYQSEMVTTSPYQPKLAPWYFQNRFPDRRLQALRWGLQDKKQGTALCVFSHAARSCYVGQRWHHKLSQHSQQALKDDPPIPTLKQDIMMDAYFAAQPGGGAPALYSNGNQQLPLYIAVCPKGASTTSVSDDEATAIGKALIIKDANNNQPIARSEHWENAAEKNGAVYTLEKNDFQHGIARDGYAALPILNAGLGDAGACRNPALTKVITVYLQSNSPATSKAVYAYLQYKGSQGGVKTLSTSDSSSNTTFNLHTPQTYAEQSFVTSAKWLSYYSWTAALNWMYDINSYSLTSNLMSQGFSIFSLSDQTGKDGRIWSGWGTNYDLIEGVGGINDGQINASNYDEGSLSDPEQERFNNNADWIQLGHSHIYKKGEQFYSGGKATFYVGTWHGPAGSGNWGQDPSHEFKGFDNYGNPIDVSLKICAGSYASDGDCNSH